MNISPPIIELAKALNRGHNSVGLTVRTALQGRGAVQLSCPLILIGS